MANPKPRLKFFPDKKKAKKKKAPLKKKVSPKKKRPVTKQTEPETKSVRETLSLEWATDNLLMPNSKTVADAIGDIESLIANLSEALDWLKTLNKRSSLD